MVGIVFFLRIAPDEGYRLLSFKINDKDVTSEIVDGTYTIYDISEGIVVNAVFESPVIRMDVNGDGEVNTADVIAIYAYIINGEESGFNAVNADVNYDNNVNTADVTTIYNYIITGE